MIFVWLLSVCMKWYQGRVKAPPHLCPRLPLFPPVPPHPSHLPRGGEGMVLAGASPAVSLRSSASPSLRERDGRPRGREGMGLAEGCFMILML